MERTLISEQDLYYFGEGTHSRLFDLLGGRVTRFGDESGGYFAVWAPNARRVSVVGDFNGWNAETHQLQPRGQSGIWEGFLPGLGRGAVYKYHIESQFGGYVVDKADPYGFMQETPPATASVLWDLDY